MELVECAECGRQISTTADSCPNCGSATPASAGTTKAKRNRDKTGFLIVALTLILVSSIGISLYFVGKADWNALHPGKIESANGGPVDPSTRLDFTKLMFIKAGSLLCPNRGEWSTFRQRTPSNCTTVPREAMVMYEEGSGIIRIRVLGIQSVVDGWTSEAELRN